MDFSGIHMAVVFDGSFRIQVGEVYDYSGGRSLQELVEYAKGGYKTTTHSHVPPPTGYV